MTINLQKREKKTFKMVKKIIKTLLKEIKEKRKKIVFIILL